MAAVSAVSSKDSRLAEALKALGMPEQTSRIIIDIRQGYAVKVYYEVIATESILDVLFAIPEETVPPAPPTEVSLRAERQRFHHLNRVDVVSRPSVGSDVHE